MKKVVLIIIIVITALLGILAYLLVFNDHIELMLKGANNIIITVNTSFNDEGIIVKNNDKVVPNDKYALNVKNTLDIHTLGKYQIDYEVKYKGKEYHILRYLEVIDDIPPVITTNLEEVTKDYCTKKISSDLTYTATDNYDGDITDNIEKTEEENAIVLKVKDSSNNETTKNITIKFKDKPSNKFTLNGNSKVYVPLNSEYKEKGTKYTDGCGEKIDAKVKITGEVNTEEVGTYKLTYEVNNEKSLTRSVIVYDPATSSATSSNKIIYLTFDDGPGYYTNKILNILDKYNVKATFFVTHQFPSYESLIKTEYESGHKIAVHTYTHNYKKIYASVEAYLDDFNKMNEIVKKYTGSYTNLFRFPGGSSNAVSHVSMCELAKKMEADGYVYFDWNVSSGDASASPTTTKVYNNVVNGVKKCDKCVVLMHDYKSVTANALDDMLNTLTQRGYTFKTLDENSINAHHTCHK